MLTTLTPRPPYPLNTDQYLTMGKVGVFLPEDRVELIEGAILRMAPIGSPHASVVNTLVAKFVAQVGTRAIVSVQAPLVIGTTSVPQPDIALLRPRYDRYWNALPTAADALLVVEVADTTLNFDIETKVPLYARSGIVEAWVVDLHARVIHAHRNPTAAGYIEHIIRGAGESLGVISIDGVVIAVDDLFPV
jgi:Uma2 family endonuclease